MGWNKAPAPNGQWMPLCLLHFLMRGCPEHQHRKGLLSRIPRTVSWNPALQACISSARWSICLVKLIEYILIGNHGFTAEKKNNRQKATYVRPPSLYFQRSSESQKLRRVPCTWQAFHGQSGSLWVARLDTSDDFWKLTKCDRRSWSTRTQTLSVPENHKNLQIAAWSTSTNCLSPSSSSTLRDLTSCN